MDKKAKQLPEAFFYILLAVQKPNHGYGIFREVEELTKGRVVLSSGTVYGAIQSWLEKEWIAIYSAELEFRKRKKYLITSEGLVTFNKERARLEELLQNASLVKWNCEKVKFHL